MTDRTGHHALPDYVQYEMGGEWTQTSLKSVLNVSYQSIVALFGPPNSETTDGKTDAQWVITFWRFGEFPTPATIYNYKDGRSYCGENGKDTDKIRRWHVGEREADVVGYIASMLLNPGIGLSP